LARRPVKRLNAPVAVPKLMVTGESVKFSATAENDPPETDGEGKKKPPEENFCHVKVDHDKPGEQIEICVKGEVFELSWNASRRHGNFLYIAKAWRGLGGHRRYRVQAHRIFSDFTIWRRKILYESKNGKELVPVADKSKVLPPNDKPESGQPK